MTTTAFSVKYRPIRIGFLVRKNQVSDLVKAAGLNSLLWGGIYNPIIPIAPNGEDNSLAESLMKLFNPDAFYQVIESEEIQEFVNRYPFIRDPGHYAEKIFYEDWHTKKNNVAYLDVINLIDKYWEKDFRHQEKAYKSNCDFIKWSQEDPLSTPFSLLFGYFPSEHNLKDNFELAFLNGLKAKQTVIDVGSNLDADLGTALFPLRFTGLDLKNYGGSRRDSSGVFFGKKDNFEDLLAFWNLRAAGAVIIYCPIEGIERCAPFIKSFLKWLDELPDAHPNIKDLISIHYTVSHEEITKIIEDFPTKKPKVLAHHDYITWNGLNIKPTFNCFEWQRGNGTVEKSFERYQINLPLPEKKFLGENSGTRRNTNEQYLAVTIDPYGDFGYPDHTLKIPNLADLNEFYSREIVFDPWKLRTGEEGLSLLIKISDETETLYPISHQKLIDKLFEYSGIKTSISQAGLLALKIINGMREFMPLEACRIFKIRGIRKLLKSKKVDEIITLNGALRTIGTDHFDKFKSLFIESRDTKNLKPLEAFNFLIKKRVLKPELRLLPRLLRKKKDFRCMSCGLSSNILASSFENDKWICQFCFEEQDLRPLVIKEFRKDKNIWYFKKYGLFSKDNNQEGAIPVILSLLTFSRIFSSSEFFFSTSYNLKIESKKFEVDFIIFEHRRGHKMEVAIGEAKDEAGEVNINDVNNLKAAREKLISKGFSCYLVFSKTADSFTSTELDLFKQLKSEEIPFILLTNSELEPYHPYWEGENVDRLPHKYALRMSEMARNSDFLYLQD